jgi:hypothetical protein
MAKSPIINFREDDFPEVKEPWIGKLLPKLNDLAKQVTNALTSRLTITENLTGFWWEGNVANYTNVDNIIKPFVETTNPTITIKGAVCIRAFPFEIENNTGSRRVNMVAVAQASDITDAKLSPVPALLSGVAWTQTGNKVVISAINGMLTGRAYKVRLLVLGD